MAHYYTADGKLVEMIPARTTGRDRKITASEAKRQGLYPSVTTLLQAASSPGLNRWYVQTAVKAAYENPYSGGPVDEWIANIAAKGSEIAENAANQGTAIHAWICALLGGAPVSEPFMNISARRIAQMAVDWLNYKGYRVLQTERPFVSTEYGYGGTIDLIVGKPDGSRAWIDIKTNEFTDNPPDYSEHRYQICAYALAHNVDFSEEVCEILYVSRAVPGLIVPRVVKNPSKDVRAFMGIAHAWATMHDWRFPPAFYDKLIELERGE
jgi:hypothetical protein